MNISTSLMRHNSSDDITRLFEMNSILETPISTPQSLFDAQTELYSPLSLSLDNLFDLDLYSNHIFDNQMINTQNTDTSMLCLNTLPFNYLQMNSTNNQNTHCQIISPLLTPTNNSPHIQSANTATITTEPTKNVTTNLISNTLINQSFCFQNQSAFNPIGTLNQNMTIINGQLLNNSNVLCQQNSCHNQMKTFLDTERETICLTNNSGLSRSNSQPDLTITEKTPTQLTKTRRHPSFSCKTSMSECSEEFYVELNEINTTTTTDDGIFLGTDAISDFLSAGSFSDILDDLPDLESLMSVVTFDSAPWGRQTQCDINIDDVSTKSNVSNELKNSNETPRICRSAPPSPTPFIRKKRSQNWPWHKAWSKMDTDEHTSAVECLTRIINDEMGLREQLEIIRIINPDVKLLPTDTQFVIDLNMIDDEKFRRIREIIKFHGLKLNEKQISDNCSECSAKSCPQGNNRMAKRELRLRRAQQRLIKHTQRKETRQILKESKSGLFTKTEVIPLSQVLPEEDIDVDILS